MANTFSMTQAFKAIVREDNGTVMKYLVSDVPNAVAARKEVVDAFPSARVVLTLINNT